MNRDELLTKLAMELAEWPAYKDYMQWDGDDFYPADYLDRNPFKKHEWLAERERLINKPNWDDAPEWARWLAQDDDGAWSWFKDKPKRSDGMFGAELHCGDEGGYINASRGKVPVGHDWRQTLERRPEFQPYCHTLDSQMLPGAKTIEYGTSSTPFIDQQSQFAKPAGDAVNPGHYQQGDVECIDALKAATAGKIGIQAVRTANIIKYLWRFEAKGGIEDVKKARWYVERLISEMEAGQ